MVFARTTPALISLACTVWVGAGTGTTTEAGGEDTTGASIRTWLAETIATGTANATAATAPASSLFLVVIVPLVIVPPLRCGLVADQEHRTCHREEARTNAKFREAARSDRRAPPGGPVPESVALAGGAV